MIVRKNLSWRRVAGYTGRPVALTFVWAVIVLLVHRVREISFIAIPATPLTMLGGAVAIFLGFRTNSAYARWWEARTLWGGLVNSSRTWTRQILSFTDSPNVVGSFERDMVYHQIAFVNAVRCHLRKQEPFAEIAPFLNTDVLDDLREEKNVPAALLLRMAMRLKEAHQDEIFDTLRFLSLNDTLTECTNLLGGCERIKNTPLPRQYDVFPRLFVYTYCALLPLGLVQDLNGYTPFVCVILGFIFIALDAIGYNIESPFENTIHDTPMSALCRTIEINLRQMLGEKDLPPAIEPVDGFLY